MTNNALQTEVSDSIMLGFSYLEAYAKNDIDQQRLFEKTYEQGELMQALLVAYDQTLWAHALARQVPMEEYLVQMREYFSKFTEQCRIVEDDADEN